MKVLVCGGRDYRDRKFLEETLDHLKPAMIVHGNAAGADTLAGRYARERGIPCTPYPPDRKLDGPGRDWKFRRNERMLHSAKPDLVAAFPGGPGTAHMVRTAKKAGYPVRQFAPEGPAERPSGKGTGEEAMSTETQDRPWGWKSIPRPARTSPPESSAPAARRQRAAPPGGGSLIPASPLPAGVPERIGQTQVGVIEYQNLVTQGSGFISAYDHVINPYSGCSFGCQYCYASNFNTTAKKTRDWGKWVQVKTNAVEQMMDLPQGELNGRTIYMATVTDPYQPVERTAKVTRGILEAMVERQPRVKLVIQTRSTLVTRDIPLLLKLVEQGGRVQVNMTVSTGDDGVRKLYEPGCSSIEARLKAIQTVHDGGLQGCVTMTPMLPMGDAAGFAGRLLETGIRRFICQPFRHPGQDRGENIARTDRRAIECAMAHFGVETAEEAVRRYNEGYRRDLQALKEVLLKEKGVVLGQDRAGFRPPF